MLEVAIVVGSWRWPQLEPNGKSDRSAVYSDLGCQYLPSRLLVDTYTVVNFTPSNEVTRIVYYAFIFAISVVNLEYAIVHSEDLAYVVAVFADLNICCNKSVVWRWLDASATNIEPPSNGQIYYWDSQQPNLSQP